MGSVKTSINQDLNCTRSLLLPTELVWPHKATQHTPRMHKLKYVAVIVHKSCMLYAPINVKPHYPPPGLTKGLVGDFRRFDQKFCPTSGAFDRSKF